MRVETTYELIPVYRIEDIPDFKDEEEEDAFWSTHEFSDELAEQAEPLLPDELPPVRAESVVVPLSIEAPVLERVKSLARRRHTGYRELLRRFVLERLEQEEARQAG